PLLRPREQNDAYGSTRTEAERFDCARGFELRAGARAVIERAGAEVVRVEVRADGDQLVGEAGAAYLAGDIRRVEGPADAVVHVEAYARCLILREQAAQQQNVFARERDCGERGEFSGRGELDGAV